MTTADRSGDADTNLRTSGRELALRDRRQRAERRHSIDRRAGSQTPAFASHVARPDSSFVAHLIAASSYAPQTRRLRREEANVATATYRGMTPAAPTRANGSVATKTA